jgi:hypothetical protein
MRTVREVRTRLVNHMRVDPFPLSHGIFIEHQEGFEPPLTGFAGLRLNRSTTGACFFELMTGIEPAYPRYKGGVMTVIRHQRFMYPEPDSNRHR